VFLLVAISRPTIAVILSAFAIVFALNLVVAVPPEGWVVPEARLIGIVGAVAMTVIAAVTIASVALAGPDEESRVGSSGLPYLV
jgi:hypothetical protein